MGRPQREAVQISEQKAGTAVEEAATSCLSFQCPSCGRCFSRHWHLKRHLATHLAIKPFRCPYCPHAASIKDKLKLHIRKECRFGSGLAAAGLAAGGISSRSIPSQDRLTCGICRRDFQGRNRRQDLERHMLTHTGEKPYKCPHCPHRTNRIGNLKTHVFSVHREKVMCPGHPSLPCMDIALPGTQLSLNPSPPPTHRDRHLFLYVNFSEAVGEEACSGVVYLFPWSQSWVSSLQGRSVALARGEEGIQCPVCGRFISGVNRKQNLERHMLTHSGERPFRCPYCPHGSNRVDNLKLHIRRLHLDPAAAAAAAASSSSSSTTT
ncbi:hypothetical protein Pcinc_014515 [Petrolisthes cinctipes]|uniref:C2H2-type domain-containing protein n=1 Tax=Petrolisthes cinctipes TaxID=88211 RepID=A0AAE1G082_PETCI|nr:hypothetical protein Pcinc_014515 [Petrolisthes cinctipes]